MLLKHIACKSIKEIIFSVHSQISVHLICVLAQKIKILTIQQLKYNLFKEIEENISNSFLPIASLRQS